jgi:hypothetical protein
MKMIKVNFEVSLPEIRRVLAMLPRAKETDALVSMTDEQLEEKFINRESLTLNEELLGEEYNSLVTAIIFLMVGTDGLNGK